MKRFFTYTTIAATLTLWAGAAQAAPSGEVVPPHPVQTIQQFLQREELQAERERQAQWEAERQAQAERERQAQLEAERQAQAERERQAQLEAERQAQAERERQAQLEAERQAQEAAESTEEAPEAESAPTLTAAPSEPAQPLQIGSPLPEPPALQEKPALKVALASGQEGELWTMYARLGRTGSQGDAQLRQSLERLSQDHPAAHEDLYLRAWRARIAAKGALAFKNDSSLSQSLAAAAQRDLQFIGPWLERYKEMVTIHGYREPAWIGGRVDAASQAVLALCDLQALHPQAGRLESIRRLAEGISLCLQPQSQLYPFGAHFSYVTAEGKPRTYPVPGKGELVAGAALFPQRQYAALALVTASQLLGEEDFLESAESEGCNFFAKLALSGNIPYSFAPRPEREITSLWGVVAAVENLLALKKATGKELYAILAGCAAIDLGQLPTSSQVKEAQALVSDLLANQGAAQWLEAKDLCLPFRGTVIELEDGKAVQKAFDTEPLEYPGGTPGHFAVVGRDNMFWMRFDVPRDDPYYFYLSFLNSNFTGGLVSVLVRIDGDQIFKVNLGGATDDPFVDCKFVDGPRQLRQGPHSVGVRFAGLLMKSPAILDSISIEPAVGRRWVRLRDGRSLLVMHSIADRTVQTRMQELEGPQGTPPRWTLLDRAGQPTPKELKVDKRKRTWLDIPPGGTVILEWQPGVEIPNLPADTGA